MLKRKSPTVVIALAMVLTVVLAAPSFGQFGRNKIQYKDHEWQVLVTPHFEIHFYENSEAFAVRAAMCLEDGYIMLADKLRTTLPWKVPVILYSSHNDFLQTNVSLQMLSEGVQAFAEPSRKRIVLPFTDSWPAFQHTAIHELSHVFSFQIIYNRLLDNVFSRTAVPGMPLWLMEGLAEYLSLGAVDPETDMFMRDGVIHDYLGDLSFAYGLAVYKQGQSAFQYIEDTYGKEKVLELLDTVAVTRSAEAAVEKTLGLSVSDFTNEWKRAARKKYWPMIADKHETRDIGRRLTDHIKQRAVYNIKPVLSPDGEKVVYLTSKDGFISINMVSALNGKQLRKLVTGHRSSEFESLHFLTSDITWSPDNIHVAFIAKSGGTSHVYIMNADKGKVVRKLDIEADGLASPTWSPDGELIVVSATFAGQNDLVAINTSNYDFWRLTNDYEDQLNPRFFPDGERLAFEYYPNVTKPVPRDLAGQGARHLAEIDFLSTDNVREGGSMDIWEIDIVTREMKPIIQTPGEDKSPVPFDGGRRMVFTSDESGISNMYVADLTTGKYHRFTDILGGLFTPDINETRGRLTFSSFDNAGWDLYISDDLEGLLAKKYEEAISVAVADRLTHRAAVKNVSAGPPFASLMRAQSRDEAERRESGEFVAIPDEREDEVFSLADDDSIGGIDVLLRRPGYLIDQETAGTSVDAEATQGGPKAADGTSVEGVNKGVGLDEPQTRGGSIGKYKFRLAPDYIGQGGGLFFSSTFGFGLANTIAMSDLLGNHRIAMSFSLIRNIEDSAVLAQYFYLKKRVNYGFGVYQYKNFINGRLTSIGESFSDNRFFSERNYGGYGLISYPLNIFDRVDLRVDAFVTEREFFEEARDENDLRIFQEFDRSKRHLVEPSMTFVHDASFFGPYGPVDGSRYYISAAHGFGINSAGVFRSSAALDYRKYFRLWPRNTFAFRLAAAASEGNDPRTYFIGGPTTLRGWDYLELDGNRMAFMNFEYRFPLLDALIIGFPGRWGFGNIQGTVFFDIGNAWYGGQFTNPIIRGVNGVQLDEVKADFGFGTQFYFGYFLLNFQLAYKTDLREVGHSQFHFYFGPTF